MVLIVLAFVPHLELAIFLVGCDNLGLSPYGRDLILHEAYVEQPLVSFRAKML